MVVLNPLVLKLPSEFSIGRHPGNVETCPVSSLCFCVYCTQLPHRPWLKNSSHRHHLLSPWHLKCLRIYCLHPLSWLTPSLQHQRKMKPFFWVVTLSPFPSSSSDYWQFLPLICDLTCSDITLPVLLPFLLYSFHYLWQGEVLLWFTGLCVHCSRMQFMYGGWNSIEGLDCICISTTLEVYAKGLRRRGG